MMSRLPAKLAILLLYGLPALAALGYQLAAYRARALDVVGDLHAYARSVEAGEELDHERLADNELATRLVRLFEKQKAMGTLGRKTRDHFTARALSIWRYNSGLIATMTLFPFLLLGGRLAFGEDLDLGLGQRARCAVRGWPRKLLIAFIVSLGWVYVLNPLGRGASVAYNYVVTGDAVSLSTLPLYIDSHNLLTHTMCGFLGWYLHLISHLFKKFYIGDVISTRVYGLFFRKILFVYGISLIVTSVASDQAKVLTFLLGFFPLSAFNLLKEAGFKALENVNKKESSLLDLPVISRWEALRLEEEAIETVPTLAASDGGQLKQALPIKAEVIDLWIDAARLESILGPELYERTKEACRTASEFIRRSQDEEFVRTLKETYKVANPGEIVRMLETTFGAAPGRALRLD